MKHYWILMGLMGLSLAQQPDPRSIEKIEYRAENCQTHGRVTRCKKVEVTFGAIRVAPRGDGSLQTEGSFVKPEQTDVPQVKFHFNPQKCKPKDRSPKFVCRDVWWEQIP